MKTKLFASLALAMFISLTAFATAPEQLSYQAVIKDASNNLVVSHAIGLKISILQTTSSGTVVYSETHTPTSNNSGLVSVAIGTGTVVSGTFASINWSTGTYFIKSEIDPTGGTSYTVTGTTQLQSVPYALHAKTVDGLTTALDLKVDKVSGKGLSTNDYTTAEQTKLSGIATGAQVNVKPDWNAASGNEAEILNKPTIANTQWTTAGSNIYYNSGNMGIGTATPAYKLDISSTSGSGRQDMFRILAGSNTTGNGSSIVLGSTQTHAGYISGLQTASNTGDLTFGTNTSGVYAENMRIVGSNGNIGIGTTTPASKISAVNNNFDASTNPGYKFYGHQSSSSATVPLFHIQTAWENTVTANVFKVNTYQNEAGFNILSNGNVGIGTTAPQAKLQVDGRVIINYAAAPGFYGQSAGANRVYLGYDGAGTGLELYNFTSGRSLMVRDNGDLTYLGNVGVGTNTPADLLQVGNLMFGGNSGREIYSTSGYDINYKATGASSHHFYANGTEKFTIDKTGNIGIGINSPSQPLSMGGGAYCTGTTWTNASDSRLKRDIQPMSKYGLSTVMQLKPVTYFYKADKTNHPEVGFIAQEVQKIVPEVVSGTEGDITKGETLGLSYGNLVPVLVKAIQEQQKQIEALTKLVEKLEKK